MQALKVSLVGNYKDGKIEKTLIDSGWFALDQRQLNLYKKLYQIICGENDYWYKIYVGIYSDDVVALLEYINNFKSMDKIGKSELKMQPEYYNSFVCESLQRRYEIMRNKLPVDYNMQN